jgi:thiosulfate reductase/polysulfide reductase chain A
MEITGWADVVLPECTYLERYDDLRISQGREMQIALRMPAFKPAYNSKPAWWMAKSLAGRLGLKKYFPWKNIEEYLDFRLKEVGSSLEEMKRLGVKKLGEEYPLYIREGESVRFKTPSGRIELYASVLERAGFDPIPRFTLHESPPSGYYRLITGRSPSHTFGRTSNNPLLAQLQPENEVWINYYVAKTWGISNGQYIVLVNQDGKESNRVKARVTEMIRPDCVYMVHGFGHTQPQMRRSFMKGADDNGLFSRYRTDPLMGGTGAWVNFVTFKI